MGRDSGKAVACFESSFPALADWRGGFVLTGVRGRFVERSISRAGDIRRRLRRRGAEEYKVVANKIASTLSRKSTRRAAAL